LRGFSGALDPLECNEKPPVLHRSELTHRREFSHTEQMGMSFVY
jgi:hypothetical protein